MVGDRAAVAAAQQAWPAAHDALREVVNALFYMARTRNRRLAKDFEASIESFVAWLLIASIKLLTRRLARA
jgi:transposase